MKKHIKPILVALLLLVLPLRQIAQQPYRQYAEDGIMLNFFEIGNPDYRLYLLYNIEQDDRFSLLAEDEYGLFIVNPHEDPFDGNFFEAFEAFYNDAAANFKLIDKPNLDLLVPQWKENVPSRFFASITMDLALNRATTINNHCVDSDPFCTSDVIQFQAANTSQTADQLEGQDFDDGCIGSSYNPSWYHMRINTPGQFIIHMEGRDPDTYVERDIDFCMWGPFTDPIAPCVSQLTVNKIIDCNYSAYYSEDIFLGFPEEQHQHQSNHGTVNFHMPETGEYYILMITNFSREPCVITFTKTEGSGPGTTDCGILPGIASNSGPYCVGETIQLNVTTQAGATYNWTGPNNFSSSVQNPVIENCTYAMGGTYTCVTMVDGQTTTGSTEVIIYPEPIADFDFTSVCQGTATQFTSTATTIPSGHDINTYLWDFGDGTTAEGQNVSHTFATAGTFTVSHTVTTGGSRCQDEMTHEVTVHAVPEATASASPSSVIYGGSSTISVNVTSPGEFTYHWEPANMVTNPNSPTTQTVGLIESQVYTCTITNTLGNCSSTFQVIVSMAGSNLTATATADQYEICEGHSTTLHAIPVAGTGEYTYSWSPANLLSGTTIQNPVATPPIGTTTFTCLVSDGITDQEVNVSVTVHPNKETDIEASICENGSYNFFGQMLNAAGVYHHTLQTQHGCDSVINLHLSLNSLNETTFIVGDDENCDEYYWDPLGHEIVYTDHEDPYYNVSGTYHRTYKNQQGCDSLVTMRVDFAYTPDPTPIYPMDPDNTAPHWVVSSTEFQINSYDFQLWDNNPLCAWDTVTWEFETEVSWVLEPFGERAKCCKMYVLNSVEDTVWMRARAFNRCEPDNGISRRYWFVCSFYGIDETNAGTFRFDVAPNPNNGQMTLCFEGLAGTVNLRVYDMRGNLIDAFDTHAASRISYDMSHRADGIYFFVATNKEGVVSRKVVVRK